MSVECFLGLGSNIGQRENHLLFAIKMLNQHKEVQVLDVSNIYESSAIGPSQRNFLNAACKLKTTLSPQQLLNLAQSIERARKRKRTVHWGPRTLDIDILTYGKKKIREPNLIVPHPHIAQRKFVLQPLIDLTVLAADKKPLTKLLNQINALQTLKIFDKNTDFLNQIKKVIY